MDGILQAADIIFGADFCGQFQQAHKHGGDPLAVADMVGLNQFKSALGIKLFHDQRLPAEARHHHVVT